MTFMEYLLHLLTMFAKTSFFEPIVKERIHEVGQQLHMGIMVAFMMFGLLPNFFIIYILKRYKYNQISAYAVISDYLMMTSTIILASCMDVFIKEDHSLIPDFVSLISPFHTLIVLHMMNPNFNQEFVKFNVSLTWTLVFSYIILINHVSSDIILIARVVLVFINILVIVTIICYIYTDIYGYLRTKQRQRRRGEPTSWEVFKMGGFPRYQIGLVHCLHWMVYWGLYFFTDVYFLYGLSFAFFSGMTYLMSLMACNDYFMKSVCHVMTCRKVGRIDWLPGNCHTRCRLENLHVWGRNRR